MLLNDTATRAARRVGHNVEVRHLYDGFGYDISPPAGHWVVAVALQEPAGHVTSDGKRLWLWPDVGTDGCIDFLGAALESPSKLMKPHDVATVVSACARLPMGELQPASFLLRRVPASPAPRWPTVIFGCTSHRLVASSLDYFETPGFADVMVSPIAGHEGADVDVPEAELVTMCIGPLGFASVVARGPDGAVVAGEPVAIELAFDAAWPRRCRIDIHEPLDAGAVIDLQSGTEIVVGLACGNDAYVARLRPSAVSKPVSRDAMTRVPLESEARLVGVTARREAVVLVEGRIDLRDARGSRTFVERSTPISGVASSRSGIAIWREDSDRPELHLL